ncbi:hypothetical protein BV25DRAFT_1042694 [Artomyces pyxidatus]|uniref:Uncharacterized protein n=1 Tax=Artomyces pyxidatus TaxID=48021 RepID=A0ACB8ST68_9AGAM|nr:hypothetical protein BV25DRAFT_1042694 [Artomyces pyxidatus]
MHVDDCTPYTNGPRLRSRKHGKVPCVFTVRCQRDHGPNRDGASYRDHRQEERLCRMFTVLVLGAICDMKRET